MLNIIYGTELSDKEEFVFNQIEKEAENKTVWILVPEQFSLSSEKKIIKRFGIKAQTKIKVITFSRLCNLVLGKLGPLRLEYIDGAGKQIIAARVMRKLKENMKTLAPNFKRRGFAGEIAGLVSELKRYGVTPDLLASAAENTESDELSVKLEDISVILENFNMLLEQGAADAEDNLSLICSKLKDCDFLSGSLYIMHFRSFTPVEYRAIGQLMHKMDVFAVMCVNDLKKPSSLFSAVAQSCRELIETAEQNGVLCTEPTKIEDNKTETETAFLAKNYFEPRPVVFKGEPKNVEIFETSNCYREVEAAADLILRLCRTENRKFSDFLILARNTASYNRIMPAVFATRGIDIFLDTRRSIITKPLAVMISSVLDILAYGYSYDRIMSIARSGIVDVSDEDIDLFENYILATDPSYAMWDSDTWEYNPADCYDMQRINETRQKLTAIVTKIEKKLSGRKTAGEICDALLSAIEEEKLIERMQSIVDSFEEKNMPYLADEYAQVWNKINMVLMQISALMDSENITWRDFGELFKNACSGITVGLTPQTQGSVVFSEIDRFRTSGVPVVIVLGVTEGVFPLPHSAEGLISDAERGELLKLGVKLAPGADAKRHEEQLLIYSVLTAAKEKLYLFSPLSGSDGKQLEPSPIIKKIKNKIMPEIKTFNPDKSGDVLKYTEGKAAAFEVLCSYLADVTGDVEKLSGAARELFEYFVKDSEYSKRLNYISEQMSAPMPEKISREAVESIYGKTIMLSASKLEKYNSCAFAYFMSYGLLASEREKAGIEPRSTGSIQHDSLYEYFTELKNKNIDYSQITKEECFEKMHSIVKKYAMDSTELLYESSAYYKYVVSRMQGIAARTAWEVVKFYKSSIFRPVGFEITIDTKGDIPALRVENTNGEHIATIRGKIDRADSAVIDGKTYVAITDYKSSQKTLDERLAEAGVNFQPLLYSDIICRRMNANPAAMLYMQMTEPIIDAAKLKGGDADYEKAVNEKISFGGWIADNALLIENYSRGGKNGEKYIPRGKSALVSEADMRKRIDAANEKIRQSAEEIYNGNVKAEPYCDSKFDACEYCIFGGICNKKGE